MSKGKRGHKSVVAAMNEAWLDRMKEVKAVNDARMREAEARPDDAASDIYKKVLKKHGKDVDKAIAELEAKVNAGRAAGEQT